MNTFQENVKSILECNLPNIKYEILDVIANNICKLRSPETNNYCDGFIDGYNTGYDDGRNYRERGV